MTSIGSSSLFLSRTALTLQQPGWTGRLAKATTRDEPQLTCAEPSAGIEKTVFVDDRVKRA
jgi:hypothetical protein